MNRRAFCTSAAFAVALASQPVLAQDGRDLARISAYLNSISTLEGEFVQVDPDGVLSEGQFYIHRPGRIRFEYRQPNPALVIADGFWVGVVDKRYDQVNRYPLNETPLNLILKDDIDLANEGAVQRIERSDGQMRIVAQDPQRRDSGSITMVFADNPLELRQWIVDDTQGGATTVALSSTRANIPAAPENFVIPESARLSDDSDR
ncbi:MAG: outer membrane lipoprotein carrier protein LolA [Paracoccaceae bacterium]|jgi:outer membrane lipoprotein-sorting protein|nr:outer membrane lipoprotein carrier protein LolA [Paracoccaceae bacterium]MDG1971492.1 outer membrane lipoprotein carrier protein LolA [Paracoccaceae bacterium]